MNVSSKHYPNVQYYLLDLNYSSLGNSPLHEGFLHPRNMSMTIIQKKEDIA